MKFIAAATLAFAATVLAAPTDPTTPPPTEGDTCPNNGKQVCCTGILTCLVQVLGGPCSSDAYCCQTDAPEGALINIALLNCVSIL